jgi:hypothetical protein
MPGLRQQPVTDHFRRASNKWRPVETFQRNERMQPYFKLHGSSGWQTDGGQPLLVIGRHKTGTMDIPCVECIVPISTAFNGDDLARGLMEGIFRP